MTSLKPINLVRDNGFWIPKDLSIRKLGKVALYYGVTVYVRQDLYRSVFKVRIADNATSSTASGLRKDSTSVSFPLDAL